MVPTKDAIFSLYPANECMRTPGGRCVGNCRVSLRPENECMRTPGGRCVGNCRVSLRPQGEF